MLERARSHAEASSSGRAHPPTRYVHWQPDSEVLPLEPASADRERVGPGRLLMLRAAPCWLLRPAVLDWPPRQTAHTAQAA